MNARFALRWARGDNGTVSFPVMKNRLWAALMVGTAALCSATIGFAQQVSTISTRFTITAAGQASPILNLSQSQATCSVQLDSAGAGLTLVPQATSDATPSASSGWATATSINTGSISTAQAAPYTGGIANTGLSGFRVLATALSSGTASGTITCSQAQTGATVTGTVTAVVSPVPLPVIVPTPLPVLVQYSPIPTNGAASAIVTSGLGAAGQNNVTIYDANGINSVDVDSQGHMRTLICNPGQTACASVNPQNALLAGFFDTTSLDTLALNAANSVLYAPALPANSFGLLSLHVVTLNGSGATLTVEGVIRQEGTYGPLTLRSDAGVVTTNGQITADGFYRANAAGYSNFRVRVSTTGSVQTATIYSDISSNSSFPILGNVTVTNGVVSASTGGSHVFVLTSASPITCTTLATGTGRLMKIRNTGPALSVFPIFYDDTGCTVAANVRFGDFTSIIVGAGQSLPIDEPIATGLSYKLSGALGATQNLVITTYGLGF